MNVTCFDRTDDAYDVVASAAVHRGSRAVLGLIERDRVTIAKGSPAKYGPFEIVISKDVFPEPGHYRLVASIVDASTGTRIDDVTRHFWVEQDAPLRQPFDLQAVTSFPEPYVTRQWLVSGSVNNSPAVQYNTSHPAYRTAEEQGENQLGEYLFSVLLEAAMKLVLDRPDTNEGEPDFHPLDNGRILGERRQYDAPEVPSRAYEEIVRYLSDVRWRYYGE